MKPITIIGGGLAGLALGNALLQKGLSDVTLHESGNYPRHRVCGEFICGRGAQTLEQLGLAQSLKGAKKHTSIQWRRLGKLVLSSTLPQPAIGISRHLLDQRLAETFCKDGGVLQENSRITGNYGSPGTILCKGREATESKWIGLKLHCSELTTEADLELHLGNRGYLGISAIEGKRHNVCALFEKRPDMRSKRQSCLLDYLRACGLKEVADRIEAATVIADSYCGVAGFDFARLPRPQDPALRLGDANSIIAPFTGNGMSIALESAAIAEPYITLYAKGELAWNECLSTIRTDLDKAFFRRIQIAGWLHPWISQTSKQRILASLAQSKLLPFNLLYRLTH